MGNRSTHINDEWLYSIYPPCSSLASAIRFKCHKISNSKTFKFLFYSKEFRILSKYNIYNEGEGEEEGRGAAHLLKDIAL